MTIAVFNVLKTVLELLLHAYVPWLDPMRYLDLSRSLLISRHGAVRLRRRIGRLRLPFVWHDGVFRGIRSSVAILLSLVTFGVNQVAFDVRTVHMTEPARVLTCDATQGFPSTLNSQNGITHLLRATAICSAKNGARAAQPSWADGALDENNRVKYGSRTYLCKPPIDERKLENVNYCYNGNFHGNRCHGNMVAERECNKSFDVRIEASGIQKQSSASLCSDTISNGTLFWVRGMKQGVTVIGLFDFAPTTLELMRRALDGPPTFRRAQIMRVLAAEATVRDRPLCRWGVPGRVDAGSTYSMLVIKPQWWIANAVLFLFWTALKRAAAVHVDFSATGCCDRLRAEAIGDGCASPEVQNYWFGVTEGEGIDLHLGPMFERDNRVADPPRFWKGRTMRGRKRRTRDHGRWTRRLGWLRNIPSN